MNVENFLTSLNDMGLMSILTMRIMQRRDSGTSQAFLTLIMDGRQDTALSKCLLNR